MFRTQYNRERVTSEPGSPIKKQYQARIDKYGNMVVESKGDFNLYAYINSFADSVDINVLLARFANGDKNALIQRAADYLDITNIPSNIADMLNLVNDGKRLFDSLPVEVKKQFDNNFNKFITTADSQEWYEIMIQSPNEIEKNKVLASKEVAEVNKALANGKPIENPGINVDVPVVEEPVVEEIKRSVRR